MFSSTPITKYFPETNRYKIRKNVEFTHDDVSFTLLAGFSIELLGPAEEFKDVITFELALAHSIMYAMKVVDKETADKILLDQLKQDKVGWWTRYKIGKALKNSTQYGYLTEAQMRVPSMFIET